MRVLFLALGAAVWTACRPGDMEVHTDTVAVGVVHHEVHLVKGPWWIHVLEIDLPRAWKAGIRLRAASAPAGEVEKTSVLASRALAGINGDFFFYQERIRVAGLQIHDGCLMQPPQGRSAFAITRDGVPLIAVFHLEMGLISAAGQTLPITGFSRFPEPAGLSLYNHHSQTFHDSVHAEVGFQLQSLEGGEAINDTVAVRVMQVRRRAWPLLLERDQWVVAAGSRFPYLERIAPGDTVQFYMLLSIRDSLSAGKRLEEAIGGGPRILRDGQISIEHAEEGLSRSFAEERHPRTAIGYSQDGRILFLLTVDGRQPGYSVGMSLAEVAAFMRDRLEDVSRSRVNAHQALNLDGGGSTTMVVRQQVANSPSDQTGERPVANALLVLQETDTTL